MGMMQTIYSQSAIYLKLTLALNWVCTQLLFCNTFWSIPRLPASSVTSPWGWHSSALSPTPFMMLLHGVESDQGCNSLDSWVKNAVGGPQEYPAPQLHSKSEFCSHTKDICIYILTNLLLFVLSFLRLCDLPHFLCVQTRTSLIQPTALCCCYV